MVQIKRKFFVGLNTGYASNGVPNDKLVDFYGKRSSASLYCAIVGNVVLPNGHPSNNCTPTITASPVWASLAQAIHRGGTIPGIQLATAWRKYEGQKKFKSKNSKEVILRFREFTSNILNRDVEQLFDSLNEGTALALDAGFRHIQLHAAHGYLFSLLIDRRLFSGADDVLGRISRWAHTWSSASVEVSVRFSLRTGDPEFDSKGSESFQDRVASLPVDYVDVSSGFYDIDKRLIYPARPDILAVRRVETVALANRHRRVSFIYSGRALQRPQLNLPPNVHIGLCRDLIANAHYLSELSHGCRNAGKCHYYSRGASHVTCARWTE